MELLKLNKIQKTRNSSNHEKKQEAIGKTGEENLSMVQKFENLKKRYIDLKRSNKLMLNQTEKFKKSLNKYIELFLKFFIILLFLQSCFYFRDFKVIPRDYYNALVLQVNV